MYGGTEYSYAQDPDFKDVSSSPKFWKKVIDAFYNKYTGFAKWHTKIVQEVSTTNKLIVPQTGRTFEFKRYPNFRGELELPITQIKNYPVQGTGNDLMALARVLTFQMWNERQMKGKLICTVHDSIVADVPDDETDKCCQLFYDAFEEVPTLFKRLFRNKYDLPFVGEIQVGHDYKNMKDYK